MAAAFLSPKACIALAAEEKAECTINAVLRGTLGWLSSMSICFTLHLSLVRHMKFIDPIEPSCIRGSEGRIQGSVLLTKQADCSQAFRSVVFYRIAVPRSCTELVDGALSNQHHVPPVVVILLLRIPMLIELEVDQKASVGIRKYFLCKLLDCLLLQPLAQGDAV